MLFSSAVKFQLFVFWLSTVEGDGQQAVYNWAEERQIVTRRVVYSDSDLQT